MTESLVGGATAAPLSMRATAVVASAVVRAARHLLPDLERGRRIDAAVSARRHGSGRSAPPMPTGAWDWKTAYDACEAATVLFLRKYGAAMRAKAASPAAMLPMLAKIASLLPTHTRRSEESASASAVLDADPAWLRRLHRRRDHAGRRRAGAFGRHRPARHPRRDRRRLACSERAGRRPRRHCSIVLFPGLAVTRFDAAQIDDHLDAGVAPSVVLMNPPFSALANVDRPHGGRRAPPCRLGAGAASRWRPSGRDHRRQLRARQSRLDRLPSAACRSAAASCSRRRSTARSMPSTARRSKRG